MICYERFFRFFSLSNRIQMLGDREFDNITLKQQFLMIALELFDEPPTLKEMGELIGCSYQNVKRMAVHLQKEGYLDMVQDAKDKRKLLLINTGKAEKMAELSGEKIADFMSILYRDIPQQDLRVVLSTLKKMDQNLGGVIE